MASITRLEVGFSARSGADLRQALGGPPLAATPVEYLTPAIEHRAAQVQRVFADRGRHLAPSIPDLLVAATAGLAGLVVLHAKETFELIAEVTGQQVQRLEV